MSGLEQAIRNALERADRSNSEIRSRIYQSARNALDAGLRKQEINDPDTIARQRQRLEHTIRQVEEEELERLRGMARLEKVSIESAPEPERQAEPEPMAEEPIPMREPPQARQETAMGAAAAPTVEAPIAEDNYPEEEDGSLSGLSAIREERQGRIAREEKRPGRKRRRAREEEDPIWAEPSTPEGAAVTPERRSRQRRKSSWLVSLFVYAVLFGVVGIGVWWVYATGMFDAAMKGNTDFDLVPQELQGENFDPTEKSTRLDPLRGFSGDWLEIYRPKGTEGVKPRATAAIEPVTDSDGAAMKVVSNAPDRDGEVLIEVPPSILRDLAGKKSTLAVTLRADGDKATQIYIQCEFGTLGDCGRHRFTVSNERADELIPLEFEGKLGPNEPGHVVINSDLTGEGRAIRVYAVRVLPGS